MAKNMDRLFRLSLLLDFVRPPDVAPAISPLLLERGIREQVARWHGQFLDSFGVANWASCHRTSSTCGAVSPIISRARDARRKRALLLDFDWLQAKLVATDINALLADFELISGDETITQLRHALRTAAHTLDASRSSSRLSFSGG